MLWTLYRYILLDLLRLLLLSLSVLVVLTASAVAIKPLSEGLLTPEAFLKFITYTIPSMVTFTLPFASAFAGCLVYLRMVNTNEVLACRASGMSYRVILGPAVLLGLLLAGTLFWMNHWIIPDALLKAQRQLERDVPHMLVTKVQRGEPMDLPMKKFRGVLYADAADDSQPPPFIKGAKYQPNRMILLRGVALAVNDPRTRRIRYYGTAEQADILTYQVGRQTWATLQLKNPSYFNADRDEFVQVEEPQFEPFVIPQVINDRFEAQSWSDLQRLKNEPETFSEVIEVKQQSVKPLAPLVLAKKAADLLTGAGSQGVWMVSPVDGQRYRVQGKVGTFSDKTITLVGDGGRDVVIEVWNDKAVTRRYNAASAVITAQEDAIDTEPFLAISLSNVNVVDPATGKGTKLPQIRLSRAMLTMPVAEPLLKLPGLELSEMMMSQYPQGSDIWRRGEFLGKSVEKVRRKVSAEMNKRLATSLASLIILTGACILAMQMQKRRPLEVYFWVFLISALSVIIIQTGSNILGDANASKAFGYAVLWLGCAFPAGMAFILYRRLVRT